VYCQRLTAHNTTSISTPPTKQCINQLTDQQTDQLTNWRKNQSSALHSSNTMPRCTHYNSNLSFHQSNNVL